MWMVVITFTLMLVLTAAMIVTTLIHFDPLQVELWQPPGLEEIFNAFVQLLLADKGFHFLRTMKNEAKSIKKVTQRDFET